MTPLLFVLACAVLGLALAFALPTHRLPVSPIGERLAKAPHPRTVVHYVEASEWA
jgi:hypothetical protein